MIHIVLATEDELSETLGEKLIKEANNKLFVSLKLRKGGFGYLKSRLGKLCELSKRQSVVIFTDLDKVDCPKKLLDEWFAGINKPDGMMFRVVVREIEAWVMADCAAFSKFFGVSPAKIPFNPDSLPDPKATLLKIVEGSRREIREAMIAKKGALAIQGVGYNTLLCEFVRKEWSSSRALERSGSLRRAFERLQHFH